MSNHKFVPHKNVPGPARLDMAVADNSGSVNSDPTFMADRLAITNHILAYSYLIDEGRWDEWFSLFSDDVAFENSTPELGTVLIKGKKAFKDLVNHRYIVPGKTSKGVRRHTQGNVHVAEQTATTAKVRTYMQRWTEGPRSGPSTIIGENRRLHQLLGLGTRRKVVGEMAILCQLHHWL